MTRAGRVAAAVRRTVRGISTRARGAWGAASRRLPEWPRRLAARAPGGRRAQLAVAGLAVMAAGAAVALAVAGGEAEGERPAAGTNASAEARSEARPASEERQDAIEDLIAEMPVEQKAAQLMLVGLEGTDSDDPALDALEGRGYAGVVIEARNYKSAGQVQGLVEKAVERAENGGHPAPWLMAPQEGGEFNAFADLPPEEAPADVRTPREAADVAREAAEALLDLDLNGILAPVLDVGPVGGGTVGRRAYSDLAERVTAYATATVTAYEEAGIFSAAKHFPGLGAASQPTEEGPANVGLTLDQLAERDLPPFRAAIEAGVPGIVVGHGLYGVEDFVTPASLSPTIVTELLREDLGFDGLAISDDITEPAITATLPVGRAAVDSVRAGIDLVYVSQEQDEQRAVYDALVVAVREGLLPSERVEEALTRNLEAKRRAGLLDELLEEKEGGTQAGGDQADRDEAARDDPEAARTREDPDGAGGAGREEREVRDSEKGATENGRAAALVEALEDAAPPELVDPLARAGAKAKGAAGP